MSDGHTRILIADDNVQLLRVLQTSLERAGYQVIVARDGAEALQRACEEAPALIVLDVTMPQLDGFAVCDRLRLISDAPIIFLSARAPEQDVLHGLALGADDYLTKPFSLAELNARVGAKLRRGRDGTGFHETAGYHDGVLDIDLERGRVRLRGQDLVLSPKQYQLLATLVRREGTIVPHVTLLSEVWGDGYENERGYLAIYVRYLRERLEEDPGQPVSIRTHHGLGYSFRGRTLSQAS